jgi:hypothetical protein
LRRVFDLVRATGEKLRQRPFVQRRRLSLANRVAQGRGIPIEIELATGRRRDRAEQIERKIRPHRPAGAAEEIFAGEIAAAAPQPAVVGHHQLAMIAQVARTETTQAEERTKHGNLRARSPQLLYETARQQKGKESIQQQSHLDAFASALRQPSDDVRAELIVANDEGADIEAALRGVDDAVQSFAGLRSIGVHLDLTNGRRREPEALDQFGGPVRTFDDHADVRSEDGRELALSEQDIQRQHDIGHQREAEHPGNRGSRRTPLILSASGQDIDEKRNRADEEMLRRSRQPVDDH